MKSLFIWLVIANLFLNSSPVYSRSLVECLGRWAKLNYINVQRNLSAWAKSIKENGPKRLLIRKHNPTSWELSEKKFYGLLFMPDAANSTKWYFSPVTTLVQAPLKLTSKTIKGTKKTLHSGGNILSNIYQAKGLEVTAFSDQFYVTKLEKLVLKNKSFTIVPRMILGNLPAMPIYAYLYAKDDERKANNQLEWHIENEYRYEDIKDELLESKITKEQAFESAAKLKLAEDMYFKVMNQLYEDGHKIADIKTTEIILNDPQFVPLLNLLMPDLWSLSNKENYPFELFDTSEYQAWTAEKIHELIQIEHYKLANAEMLSDYILRGIEDERINHIIEDERLARILHTTKLSKLQKLYHMQKIIDIHAQLSKWESMGIKFKLENGEFENFDRWLDEYLINQQI